jgi:hypothetical protein
MFLRNDEKYLRSDEMLRLTCDVKTRAEVDDLVDVGESEGTVGAKFVAIFKRDLFGRAYMK